MARSVVQLLLGEKSLRDVQQKSCTKRLVKETRFWGMFFLFYLSHVFWVPADVGRGVTAAEPCSWPVGNRQRLRGSQSDSHPVSRDRCLLGEVYVPESMSLPLSVREGAVSVSQKLPHAEFAAPLPALSRSPG